MPRMDPKKIEEMEALARIQNYLLNNGNLERAIYEEAPNGKETVKRFVSPLLEKKDWRYLDKVVDEILAMHKDPVLRSVDESIRKAMSPDRDKLARNDPAHTPEELERRARVFERLRKEGLLPPQTENARAADAAEIAAARASSTLARTAKHVDPNLVKEVGIENAKLLAELSDPKSPLGAAFGESAADKATGDLINRIKGSGGRLKGQGGSATLGAMGALIAGGTTLAIGGSAKDAAKEAGVALVNVIPGVNVLTAPNADEAKVRSDVALATGGSAGVGAVLGAGVGGVVTGLVGNLVSDEIRRGYARYVDGKTETVAPAAGETFAQGIVNAGGKAVDAVKQSLTTAVDHLAGGTPTSAGVKTANPVTKDAGLKK